MKARKNVCLIDDDEVYQFLCKKTIEGSKHIRDIIIFSNGKEALDYFIENKQNVIQLPDVVFLDLDMPLMDGWQFLDEYIPLKSEIGKQMTIYIVTSSSHPADLSKAKEINDINGYLIKPITTDDFNLIMESC